MPELDIETPLKLFTEQEVRDMIIFNRTKAAASERERCALIAENEHCTKMDGVTGLSEDYNCDCGTDHRKDIAEKIRGILK